MRRNYGDAEHATARTTRRTTHIHANISSRHTNRATHHKHKTCTSRSMEEGCDGVVRGARVHYHVTFHNV